MLKEVCGSLLESPKLRYTETLLDIARLIFSKKNNYALPYLRKLNHIF